MLDFYYTERLEGRRRPASLRRVEETDPIEEQVRRAAIPLGYLALRRAGELAAIVITLPVMLGLCALIAAAIALDSPGPVIFLQKRRGRGGRIFLIAKFRSMNTEDRSGAVATMHDDPRVTRLGRFLRRYHLDELPQLWNVLRGEMSLIGPRPEPLPLSEGYEKIYPHYRLRYMVKPGITGWAQVNQGYTSDPEDIRVKLEHDFHYILNLSPRLDFRILIRTLRVLPAGARAR